jgi:hypothetical protein
VREDVSARHLEKRGGVLARALKLVGTRWSRTVALM